MPCKKINHPNIAPGWGCCQCRTYNGIQRHKCKHCGHIACHTNIEVSDLLDELDDDKGVPRGEN